MSEKPIGNEIPYKIAVLVYVVNSGGELLLLHRKKPPNRDLYSPIGGKLEQATGESPHACALREIEEEIGVRVALEDLRLLGIVSERAYAWDAKTTPSAVATHGGAEGAAGSSAAHWLMFCFEVTRPLQVMPREMEEGRLEWHAAAAVERLNIPRTDREVIWPLVRAHAQVLNGPEKARTFCVHIDCTDAENFVVTMGR